MPQTPSPHRLFPRAHRRISEHATLIQAAEVERMKKRITARETDPSMKHALEAVDRDGSSHIRPSKLHEPSARTKPATRQLRQLIKVAPTMRWDPRRVQVLWPRSPAPS
jgi:hypothetical protein